MSPVEIVQDPIFKTVTLLFEKWIWRLRLQDWEIRWHVVPREELPPDKSGSCDSSTMKKIANVKILHPRDADPAWLDPYDVEVTIVHELTHLTFSAWALLFDEGDQANLFLEQAVHTTSRTLVEADRGSGRWSANFPEKCDVRAPHTVVQSRLEPPLALQNAARRTQEKNEA